MPQLPSHVCLQAFDALCDAGGPGSFQPAGSGSWILDGGESRDQLEIVYKPFGEVFLTFRGQWKYNNFKVCTFLFWKILLNHVNLLKL